VIPDSTVGEAAQLADRAELEATIEASVEASLEILAESTETPIAVPSQPGQGAWAVFGSTAVTIFLAELGDKTQITTLLMTAQSHNPWVVFAGAGSALICTSLLGVLLGRWLATRLDRKTLDRSAGITLLVLAAGLIWDISRSL
jgi:Ca2+/H+ antiporter, TMEM165/GDT1 family